ncbi:MAG: TIGR03618 family F420-dependent PPOX class oxidoreductase [Caldilineaceae bacterium]|nr:TIGR03618 family F420-dependent PPOX class oxidoreductase [Caldilineaceae bacterium]
MTPAEIKEFLAADRNAVLATQSSDGIPQLTPVWFLYEDGLLYVSAQVDTVKVRNLRRNPAIAVCIDGGRRDARYVVLRGQAELIEPGQPRQEEMRRRIIRKYHSDMESADRYYESVRDSRAALIVLRPEKIVG